MKLSGRNWFDVPGTCSAQVLWHSTQRGVVSREKSPEPLGLKGLAAHRFCGYSQAIGSSYSRSPCQVKKIASAVPVPYIKSTRAEVRCPVGGDVRIAV